MIERPSFDSHSSTDDCEMACPAADEGQWAKALRHVQDAYSSYSKGGENIEDNDAANDYVHAVAEERGVDLSEFKD